MLPVALIVGIVGLIAVMYASGARQLAGGFGFFGFMAAFSAVGLIFRGRGAARKMSWGELTAARRKWFGRQDEVRDEIDVQRRLQWEYRRHFHWNPQDLVGVAGSVRMWDREPGSKMFSVVRVGVGTVKLAMTLEKPEIAPAADLEPATGHALRKFLNAQEYVEDVPKAIWLQRFPGISIVGDVEEGRSLARAVLCQLAAFHSPLDVQIIVVSAAPEQWEWAKWLPHFQHESLRDGCGERRMLFGSPAQLETFLLDAEPDGGREAWSAPSSSLSGGNKGVLPLRVIVDDNCATPEDWAGLTGALGYAGTCFIRLAADVPARPAAALSGGATNWVGFAPETTYRIEGGVLRKRVPLDRRRQAAAAMYRDEEAAKSDELEEAFYANADQMSVDDAERFARTVARYRAKGSVNVTVALHSTASTGSAASAAADRGGLPLSQLGQRRVRPQRGSERARRDVLLAVPDEGQHGPRQAARSGTAGRARSARAHEPGARAGVTGWTGKPEAGAAACQIVWEPKSAVRRPAESF